MEIWEWCSEQNMWHKWNLLCLKLHDMHPEMLLNTFKFRHTCTHIHKHTFRASNFCHDVHHKWAINCQMNKLAQIHVRFIKLCIKTNMHELTKVSFKHAFSTTHCTLCVRVFYCQKNCSDHLSKETHGILSSARFPEIHTHTHTHREWAIFPFRVCVAFQFHILFQVWKANRIWAQVTSVSFPEIRSLLFWLSQTEGITHPWPVDWLSSVEHERRCLAECSRCRQAKALCTKTWEHKFGSVPDIKLLYDFRRPCVFSRI